MSKRRSWGIGKILNFIFRTVITNYISEDRKQGRIKNDAVYPIIVANTSTVQLKHEIDW